MEPTRLPPRIVPNVGKPLRRVKDALSSRFPVRHTKTSDSREGLLSSPTHYARPDPYAPTSSSFLHRHRQILYATPPVLGGILWAAMMTYFLVYYQTLPRDTSGHLPRIGDSYSTWPYISCIGATRLSYFRGFACAVAPLVITAFVLDFKLGSSVRPGRRFRIAKLCFGTISSVFLVALSMESVNNSSHLHLIFTSIQILGMGLAKASDYFLSYLLRRHDRRNPHLVFAQRWKRCVGIIAAPTSVVTVIGIYGCAKPVGILPPTAKCYKLSSFSAPCEWILSACWILYLFAIGYDLYHGEEVAKRIEFCSRQVGHSAAHPMTKGLNKYGLGLKEVPSFNFKLTTVDEEEGDEEEVEVLSPKISRANGDIEKTWYGNGYVNGNGNAKRGRYSHVRTQEVRDDDGEDDLGSGLDPSWEKALPGKEFA